MPRFDQYGVWKQPKNLLPRPVGIFTLRSLGRYVVHPEGESNREPSRFVELSNVADPDPPLPRGARTRGRDGIMKGLGGGQVVGARYLGVIV